MGYDNLNYERRADGDVVVVSIDRPERKNAVDRETAEELRDAWRRFDEGDAVAGVLTGRGGDFSAGADLREMNLVDEGDGWLGMSRLEVDKPTVAAVEGYCVAGGLELALWCDLRVASETAVFGCFERRYGVPLVDGGTQRLPRVVGLGRALDMIETGRAVEAREAFDWGLANRLVDEGDAVDVAVDLCRSLTGNPQDTLRADRRAVYAGLGLPVDRGLEVEASMGSRVMSTAVEGAERFRDEREG
ncbi:MAG: crotonase/enoyl-CoA hydratase family protein [Halobacteriota archaeon]